MKIEPIGHAIVPATKTPTSKDDSSASYLIDRDLIRDEESLSSSRSARAAASLLRFAIITSIGLDDEADDLVRDMDEAEERRCRLLRAS